MVAEHVTPPQGNACALVCQKGACRLGWRSPRSRVQCAWEVLQGEMTTAGIALAAAAASLIPGVDATLVRASAHDGSTVGAATGLAEEAIERHVVSGPPDGSEVRAISLSYLYPGGAAGRSSIRSGLAVPLHGESD